MSLPYEPYASVCARYGGFAKLFACDSHSSCFALEELKGESRQSIAGLRAMRFCANRKGGQSRSRRKKQHKSGSCRIVNEYAYLFCHNLYAKTMATTLQSTESIPSGIVPPSRTQPQGLPPTG